MKVDVTMPKMGESITEGTVLVWHKQPGDRVELDETLLEIGTDKVDTEVPSPAAGVVQEILVAEGDTVDVGTTIAVIATEDEAEADSAPAGTPPAAADESPSPGAPAEDAAAVASVPEPEEEAPAPSTPTAAVVDVVMPKMGESITEGTVLVWHKQPGDRVELDETLLEIGTDKVDTEVPSPAAGVVQEILVAEGDTVDVGTTIARIAGESAASSEEAPVQEPPAAAARPGHPASPPPASGDGALHAPTAEPAGAIGRHTDDGRFISPLVRSIAEAEGITKQELERLSGSGHDGRITKQDILRYLQERGAPHEAPPARPAPGTSRPVRPTPAAVPAEDHSDERVEIIEMDRMRQIIAEHMVRSKATSPHVTSFAEADVTNLVRLRERNKAAFQEREGIKLTFTPFFVHAAVEALREHPILNASVEGTRILVKKDYHVGIAVNLDKRGLIVPVIRDAGRKNLSGLAHAANDLAERARSKQLQPDDLQGGTFTVTNVGSLGSIMGTPIIYQPQVAILATGAIRKRPVVIEDPELGDVIAIRHMMYLSLSYDHRIIDGAMGVSFLRRFVDVVEALDPEGEV